MLVITFSFEFWNSFWAALKFVFENSHLTPSCKRPIVIAKHYNQFSICYQSCEACPIYTNQSFGNTVGSVQSFTIDGKPSSLTVYLGKSTANQIAGILAGILLEEVLGYENVVFVSDSLPGSPTVKDVNAYITKTCPKR